MLLITLLSEWRIEAMDTEMYYQKAFTKADGEDSQYFKGICYTFGYRVNVDLEKAKNAYAEGAKNKNAKCMYGLAILLLKSKTKADAEAAQNLFCGAFHDLYEQAQLDDPIAQRMVSCYYLFGDRGVSKNTSEAKKWLLKAAENGDSEAQMNLAHCYEMGVAFPLDLNLALEWYAKAAAQGNRKAGQKLDEMRKK